jgi:hypothetical protein
MYRQGSSERDGCGVHGYQVCAGAQLLWVSHRGVSDRLLLLLLLLRLLLPALLMRRTRRSPRTPLRRDR